MGLGSGRIVPSSIAAYNKPFGVGALVPTEVSAFHCSFCHRHDDSLTRGGLDALIEAGLCAGKRGRLLLGLYPHLESAMKFKCAAEAGHPGPMCGIS